MGDPALNDAVLEAIERLPDRVDCPGLMPCISTVAPIGRDGWFDRLTEIKRRAFPGGRFQMQFSLHTTDEPSRRHLVPIRCWSHEQIARFGERFFVPGDRRLTLNFAPAVGLPLDPAALTRWFDPEIWAVKLTPINPTAAALASGLEGRIDPHDESGCRRVADGFRARGYETILSIGELDENAIGSNCGMYVDRLRRASEDAGHRPARRAAATRAAH